MYAPRRAAPRDDDRKAERLKRGATGRPEGVTALSVARATDDRPEKVNALSRQSAAAAASSSSSSSHQVTSHRWMKPGGERAHQSCTSAEHRPLPDTSQYSLILSAINSHAKLIFVMRMRIEKRAVRSGDRLCILNRIVNNEIYIYTCIL